MSQSISHSAGADISITQDGGVQVVRFNRVDKKNAFSRPMYAAMVAALDHADASDDIAVTVFFGAPGAFSAGNDMTDFVTRAQGKIVADQPGAVSARLSSAAYPADRP